jgi:glycosyltransferase involved in cell wall biosynthesis
MDKQDINGEGVTVIVPVYNGARTILETIGCLLDQTMRPREIIVVDDGSTDETERLLTGVGDQITCLRKERGGPASARNLGVRAAKSEFVAFTDSDCLPDRDWLKNLCSGFNSPRVAGVGGIVRSVDKSLVAQYIDAIKLLDPRPDDRGQIPYLITANACFRRAAIVDAGYFDERFRKPGGEEPELCIRIKQLGFRFRKNEDARVLHFHQLTVGELWRTISNYGEGRYLIGQRFPDYRIEQPGRRLARKALSLRSMMRKGPIYSERYGFPKAAIFCALDYLRELALLSGYIRAGRREI